MKKLLKRISVIVLATALLGALLVYYLITYRFKESLRYAVTVQTKGAYAFEAGEASVSLWQRAIRLRHSSVRCLDPQQAPAAYDVDIPDLYVSLVSWKDLVLHRKMVVDSLALVSPRVSVNRRQRPVHDVPKRAFKGTDILGILEKTLTHFNAHSFNIRGAQYIYTVAGQPGFRVNDIHLSVRNFTGVNNEDSHFFGSERVVFSLGRQAWQLPQQGQQIRFSALRFDSRGQRLEIDSAEYVGPDSTGKGALHFKADQLFFNSRHLPALYQHNRLLIDTLNCVNPVVTVPPAHKKHVRRDTSLAAASHWPFSYMQVGVVNVVNAAVHLQGRQAATRNSHLGIYNLQLQPGKIPPLSFDSVRLNLRDLVFYSRDSLYQMRIAEFATEKDVIVFKGVTYLPAPGNKAANTVTATAPALRLKRVNIESLLRKHLRAEEAELLNPVITVHTAKSGRTKVQPLHGKNLSVFYETLHGISEMVHVKHFRLREAALHYQAGGTEGTALHVSGINAHILLHQLFLSDSLVDIKHAIPDLRVKHLNLRSKGHHLAAHNYRFDGVQRRNWGDSLVLALHNGTRLQVRNIFWEAFDWDVFHNTGHIQVDRLKARSVSVELPAARHTKAAPTPLPPIWVGAVEADAIAIAQGGALTARGGGVLIRGLQSAGHHFTWREAGLRLSALHLRKPGWELRTGGAQLHTRHTTTIQDIQFSHGATVVTVPAVSLSLPLLSTDFSTLEVPFLHIPRAQARIAGGGGHDGKQPFQGLHLPLRVRIGALRMDSADVAYSGLTPADTLQVRTGVQCNAREFRADSSGLSFHHIALTLSDIRMEKSTLMLQLPHSRLELQKGALKGKDLSVTAALSWTGGMLRTSAFSGEQLSGSITPAVMRWRVGEAFNWQTAAAMLAMNGGKLQFVNGNMRAGAGSLHLAHGTLRLKDVFMQPLLSREATFQREQWQGNYMTLNRGTVTVSGLDAMRMTDTPLQVPRVLLEGVDLHVSRDKHLPFRHGIHKFMPTQLVRQVRFPFRVDTIAIANSTVTYAERPPKADTWNEIPLTQLQGTILRLGNRFGGKDSLFVNASANVFNAGVRHLTYVEAYADTLAGFTASLGVSAVDLPELGGRMMPHGKVQIRRGTIDTVYSNWQGNTYAAYGQMHFYYDRLRLRIGKRGLLPAVETWLVNLIVPSRITKPSLIFTPRDQERFIFNYWINVQKSGVMSAVGLKRNRKYRKQYRQFRQQFRLPPSPAGF